MRNKIETKRLVLRPFVQTDWRSLVNYAGNIDVARATGRLPHPYSFADAQNWIEITKASDENHIYGIAPKDNHLIGCISLTKTGTDDVPSWELGYWLGQPHWHKGYMREASSALLHEARARLSPTKLHATVFKDNSRSLALLRYHGFTHAAQTSEFCVARGHDVEAYRLAQVLEVHNA